MVTKKTKELLTKSTEHYFDGNEHYNKTKFPEAIHAYTQGIELLSKVRSKVQKFPLYRNRADTYKKLSHHNKAVEDYTEALTNCDNSFDVAETLCSRAESYAQLKKYDDALNDCNHAIKMYVQDRDKAYAHRTKVYILHKMATEEYEQAYILDGIA